MSATIAPCVGTAPLSPGWRNEFHAGLQQAFGKYFVLDGEYIWKYTHKAYDFSVLGDTPITFPIEWAQLQDSRLCHPRQHAELPRPVGVHRDVHVAARFFEPQVSGIGATPVGSEVFRIDHDEIFNPTTHLQYQTVEARTMDRLQLALRQRPGGRPGAVRGRQLRQRSERRRESSWMSPASRRISSSRPDSTAAACHATPTTPISPTGLCPASQYGSTLLKIPAPGTEDDDHNPPRIASRNLFDIAIGHDNLFHGDRYKWSARLSVVNLTNKEALYNFLSTFSGTHYVTPRAVTGTIGFHF